MIHNDHRDPGIILEELEALIGRPDMADDYVRFRIALFQAQEATRDAATKWAQVSQDGGSRGDTLTAETLPLDAELLAGLFEAVCVAIHSHGGNSEDLERLAIAAQATPGFLERLARFALPGSHAGSLSELSTDTGASADAITFICRVLAAPFIAATGIEPCRDQSDANDVLDDTSQCGVCGSPPGLASLEGDEGRRVLHCSLCANTWAHPRIACARCGSTDQDTLGKLLIPDDEARWIELCDKCGGYIKTVDRRKLPEGEGWVALVEEVATLPMDLLAEQEGLLRNLPYVALQ